MSKLEELPFVDVDVSDALSVLQKKRALMGNPFMNDTEGNDQLTKHLPGTGEQTIRLINLLDVKQLLEPADDPETMRILTVIAQLRDFYLNTDYAHHCPPAIKAFTERGLWLSRSTAAKEDNNAHVRHLLQVYAALHILEEKRTTSRVSIISLLHPDMIADDHHDIIATAVMPPQSVMIECAVFSVGEDDQPGHFIVSRPYIKPALSPAETAQHPIQLERFQRSSPPPPQEDS